MKAQILKIAGVKNEKEFYKKFPTEEAFLKKHGKELKKAQVGMSIEGATETAPVKPINFGDMYAESEANNMGISLQEKQRQEALAATAASKQSAEPSGMAGMIGGAMKALGGDNGDIIGNVAGMFERGGRLPKAQGGGEYADVLTELYNGNANNVPTPDTTSDWTNTLTGFGWDTAKGNPTGATYTDSLTTGTGAASTGGGFGDNLKSSANALLGQAGSIIGNIEAIGQMQKEQNKQEQFAKISDITAQAAESQDVDTKRQKRYVRPEDMAFQPGEMGNPYGQGTNYLAARNGAEIANTFAPNTIYTNLGYEPLNDSNVKQYQFGGIASGIGSWFSGGGFQESPEGKIGSVAGKTIGSLIPIPGASIIGEAVGGLAGGIFGGNRQAKTNDFAAQGRQNTGRAAAAGVGKAARSMYRGNLEDGGWVSNDWMPQTITKFGEYNMKELLAPPHDADMLRSGGHLAQVHYTPPSAAAMYTGRMDDGGIMHSTNMMFDTDYHPRAEDGAEVKRTALNGAVQTTWGGGIKTLSHNPYMPGTGETIQFVGNSHDTYDPKSGNTGIGVKYGDGGSAFSDYAEYGTRNADANVEVEKEPAAELIDPETGKPSLNVYGALRKPGTKQSFKSYISDLSKVEAKQNKIISKSTNAINSLEVNDPFSRLTFAANQANILGANMKLKEIAQDKMDSAAEQNAILDTAKEYKLVAADLAKGKIVQDKEAMKKAKFGAKMETAQFGINASPSINGLVAQGVGNFINTTNDMQGAVVTPDNFQSKLSGYKAVNPKEAISGLVDLLKAKGVDTNISSGYRAGAKTKQGNKSRHATNEAMDLTFPGLGKDAYQLMVEDKDIARYMSLNGLTAIDEYNPKIAKKVGATGPNVHIGLDAGTPTAEAYRKAVAERHPDVVQEVAAYSPIAGTSASMNLPQLPEKDVKYLQDLYAKAEKVGKGPEVLKFQEEFHRLAPDYARSVIASEPLTAYGKKMGYGLADLRSNADGRMGKRSKRYVASIANAAAPAASPAPIAPKAVTPVTTPLSASPDLKRVEPTVSPATPNPWNARANFVRSLMPWLAPSNQEDLDPSQLSGEMMALATNQVAPVQAQLVQPLLQQPYDISLQDQLNANQADFNAMQRQTGYNPEALAALAAQKYAANQSVLGNQFRANQEMKAGVYNKNREILNQTQLQNLGILDQQYTRQEQAKSNTKAQAIAALNSINDKILKNKLDNRKLSIYENMYGYRFGPNGQAYNVNGPASLNFSGNPSSRGGFGGADNIAPGYEPLYNTSGQLRQLAPTKDKTSSTDIDPLGLLAKNGKKIDKNKPNSNIVKAIKNL